MVIPLLLAIIPGLAIAWFIYRVDKYEREKFWPLTFAFLTGMLLTLPLMEVQEWFFKMGLEKPIPSCLPFSFPLFWFPAQKKPSNLGR